MYYVCRWMDVGGIYHMVFMWFSGLKVAATKRAALTTKSSDMNAVCEDPTRLVGRFVLHDLRTLFFNRSGDVYFIS